MIEQKLKDFRAMNKQPEFVEPKGCTTNLKYDRLLEWEKSELIDEILDLQYQLRKTTELLTFTIKLL